MRELTKSLFSSSLALSLVGAKQLAATLVPTCRGPLSPFPQASLESVTQTATSGLSRRFQHYFEIGDNAQRGLVDLANAAVRLDASGLLKPGADVANAFVESLGPLASDSDMYVDWQELRNKIDIYDLVRNVDSRLNVVDGAPIAELVDRGYALGDFHALWAVEGLGHFFAEQAFKNTDKPYELLSNPNALQLPDKSLSMLNAGIGLAFAEKLLREFSPLNGIRVSAEVIQRFIKLCEANATVGYLGCALESLGLVAQTFFPATVNLLDEAIQSIGDENLLGYFWHGVGRGNYFSLRHFLPCCGISWAQLITQSVHATGQQNLVAGLAWAITLVNMQTPQVMHKLLRRRSCELVTAGESYFINGVGSAIAVRSATSPESTVAKRFCDYVSSPVWDRFVRQPCAADRPSLTKSRQLEVFFRYQDR